MADPKEPMSTEPGKDGRQVPLKPQPDAIMGALCAEFGDVAIATSHMAIYINTKQHLTNIMIKQMKQTGQYKAGRIARAMLAAHPAPIVGSETVGDYRGVATDENGFFDLFGNAMPLALLARELQCPAHLLAMVYCLLKMDGQ